MPAGREGDGCDPRRLPDPSSVLRPAEARPLSICPADDIFNRPARAGTVPPLSLSRRHAVHSLPSPRRTLSPAATPYTLSRRHAVHSLPSPATVPPSVSRPMPPVPRHVLLLFVALPLAFSLPPKSTNPPAAGAAGGFRKSYPAGAEPHDATPAYRMRTRITPFVPARARAVSSLGQEAMSMSV